MIITLVDHNRRPQFSKDIKTLDTKKGKDKSFIEKKEPIASPTATLPYRKKSMGKNIVNTVTWYVTIKNHAIT